MSLVEAAPVVSETILVLGESAPVVVENITATEEMVQQPEKVVVTPLQKEVFVPLYKEQMYIAPIRSVAMLTELEPLVSVLEMDCSPCLSSIGPLKSASAALQPALCDGASGICYVFKQSDN
ncbi:hypothetical protein WH47_12210 [Habropoda laboriosa]|uniref:Uncharacterized protein n=2 Tax=Habropoda laboriosa TaxID=597456 RepID=A0A0L7RAM2_9HYME|nr:hypothetical protein WH47_12210 [Habropoda laboriosa]